jgi:ankyrin repeat protein/Holliday junction resolvasome RuvABC ATP-dependent DNA helicase subunit
MFNDIERFYTASRTLNLNSFIEIIEREINNKNFAIYEFDFFRNNLIKSVGRTQSLLYFNKIAKEKLPTKDFYYEAKEISQQGRSSSSRFSPDSAFSGNAWQNSSPVGDSAKNKVIFIQNSAFLKGGYDHDTFLFQLQKLKDQGFKIFCQNEDGNIVLYDKDDFTINYNDDIAKEEVSKIFAEKSISKDMTLVIDKNNKEELFLGLFYNYFNFKKNNDNSINLSRAIFSRFEYRDAKKNEIIDLALNKDFDNEILQTYIKESLFNEVGEGEDNDIDFKNNLKDLILIRSDKNIFFKILEKYQESEIENIDSLRFHAICHMILHSDPFSKKEIDFVNEYKAAFFPNFIGLINSYDANSTYLDGNLSALYFNASFEKVFCEFILKDYSNAEPKDLENLMLWSIEFNYHDVFKAILKCKDLNNIDKKKIFSKLLYPKNQDLVSFCLDNNFYDFEARRPGGTNILSFASGRGDLKMVKSILEKGFAVDVKNNYGETALMKSLYSRNKDVVEFLLEKGADLHVKADDGNSLLHDAATFTENQDIIELLLEKDIRLLEEKNNRGETALDIAIRFKNEAIIELLLKKGAIASGDIEFNLPRSFAENSTGDKEDNKLYVHNCATNKNGVPLDDNKFNMVPIATRIENGVKNYSIRVRENPLQVKEDSKFKKYDTNILEKEKIEIPFKNAQEFSAYCKKCENEKENGYYVFKVNLEESENYLTLPDVTRSSIISAIKTEPENAITELCIDKFGFHQVKINKNCKINYVVQYDAKDKAIETNKNDAIKFVKNQKFLYYNNKEIPHPNSFLNYQSFLENVISLKSKKTSCGIRVAACIYEMKKKGLWSDDFCPIGVDNNHIALQFIDTNKTVHYLDLGGVISQHEYLHEYLNDEQQAENFKYNTILKEPQLDQGQKNEEPLDKKPELKKDLSDFLQNNEEETDNNQQVKKEEEDLLSEMRKFFSHKNTVFNSKDDFKEIVKEKSSALFVAKDSNKIVQSLREYFQENNEDLKFPIFFIKSMQDFDIDKKSIKILENDKVEISETGFLQDFIQQFSNLKDDSVTPILVIDWSKFTSKERLSLNSVIDKDPNINGISLQKFKIISVDSSISSDSSFISRHGKIFNAMEFNLKNNLQQSSKNSEIEIDLCGKKNWKAELFGDVILDKNNLIWNKSDFVEKIKQLKDDKISLNFKNCSQNKELLEFIEKSKAVGFFEYHGYKIKIPNPKNINAKIAQNKFNFSEFSKEAQHEFFANYTINEVPSNSKIINPQTFDFLLYKVKIAEGKYQERLGLIKDAKDKKLKIFITSQLSDAQFYILFNEAKKHEVKLDLYFSKGVKIPKEFVSKIKYHEESEKSAKNKEKLKASILLSLDPDSEILNFSDHDGLVFNVEDLNYSNLIKEISYEFQGDEFTFKKQKTEFINKLKSGTKIVLKGDFGKDLLDNIQPILMKDYAKNLILIIENKEKDIPAHLEWLPDSCKLNQGFGNKNIAKKEVLIENFDQDISSDDFIFQRKNLVLSSIKSNRITHLVGKSGVGKTSILQEMAKEDKSIKLFCGVESIEEWANSNINNDEESVLFVDEVNILKCHMTFMQNAKDGRAEIFYEGKVITLSDRHKVVFASNPIEFGGGRNEQKIFADGRVQQIDFSQMPKSHILKLLIKNVFNKTDKSLSDNLPEFEKHCNSLIEEYQKFLNTKDEITIRELEQQALEFVTEKEMLKFEDLKTNSFVSTDTTKEIEMELLNVISLINLQKDNKIPNCGTKGILLEGTPGIGKSVMIEEYLKKYCKQGYRKIEASMDFATKKKIICEAFEEGIPVFIDEIDAIIDDGIERFLNFALSGFHPDESKQNDQNQSFGKGFALFATANGITESGRSLIPPSIRHRIKCSQNSKNLQYESSDLEKIIKSWNPQNFEEIQEDESKELKIAEAFLECKEELESSLNLRDLRRFYEKNFIFEKPKTNIEVRNVVKLNQMESAISIA